MKQRNSKSRDGAITILLERFLDDYEDGISPQLWNALEDLADEMESIENDLNTKMTELESEVERLEEEYGGN